MPTPRAASLLLVLSTLSVALAGEPAVDPQAAAERLAGAIRLRTIQPADPADFDGQPFLELHAYLAHSFPRAHQVLRREVIGDYSLLYTWPGSEPSLDPIVVLGHQDVVPVEPGTEARWTHPPFAGVVADGRIWGRGAQDDKLTVLGSLEAVEHLLAAGFQPRRTVMLAFGHDEETGGREGAARIAALLRQRGVRPWFTIDEGMVITSGMAPGVKAPVAFVGVAEKGYLSLELTARGTAGHSSMPAVKPGTSAITALAQALSRLDEDRFRPHVREPVASMLRGLAPHMHGPQKLVYAHPQTAAKLLIAFMNDDPATNALIRTTTAFTILSAGNKDNVVPGEARATVNFRLLPGDSLADVRAHVAQAVQGLPIEVRELPDADAPSPVSSTQGEAYRTLTGTIREVFPDAVVAPALMIGGTDSKHYVGLARNCYRFLPMRLDSEGLERIHGSDEQLTLANYAEIIRFYTRLIERGAGGPGMAQGVSGD